MRPARTGFGDTAAPGRPRRAGIWGGGAVRLREGALGTQAPPPAPAGREGEAVASAQRARRGGESGGGGQSAGPAATRYTEPGAGAGAPPTRSRARPLLSGAPPPRAALSIHKFSVGSAATELQSQPGALCIRRPPSRRPWAARPGAEVGAAGPGDGDGRGRAGGCARPGDGYQLQGPP